MSQSYTTNKTLKRRDRLKKKSLLWDKFDESISEVECIYSANDHSKKNYHDSDDHAVNDKNEIEKCKCCDSKLALSQEGFMTCTNKKCGVLYKNILDLGAEWRYYGADDNQSRDPTRCGMPTNPLLKESSFGCRVICPYGASYEMRKIKRYTDWQSMPYKEKSQYDEFQKITIRANHAGIPKMIIEDAMRYHKKISEAKTFRGLNRDGIIAASIYVSSRINKYPRTAKEIASIFHLDNTSATRGCKNAIAIINDIEHELTNEEKTTLCNTTPASFIDRYCSRLNINQELTKLCLFIAHRIETNNYIPENTPHSIAAGIVYFVSQICNLNISKHDVHNISEISEVTINKCNKKLDLLKDRLIPGAILKKYGSASI